MVPTKALGSFSVKLWKVLSTELLPRKSIVGAGCLLALWQKPPLFFAQVAWLIQFLLSLSSKQRHSGSEGLWSQSGTSDFSSTGVFWHDLLPDSMNGEVIVKKKKSHKRNLHKIEFYFTIDIHLRKLYPWERKKNLSEVVIYIFLNYGREYSSIFIRLAWSL